jgi:hypothetical protein
LQISIKIKSQGIERIREKRDLVNKKKRKKRETEEKEM